MSIPNTFNPSDYEYLIRSLSEGSHPARAETLRRFITLAGSDKKQFSLYSKRIVLALQELICEPKQEINLTTSMLILQIINLNPKDIEYYLRTKLLRKIVLNLGDTKPQLRKTSHFCILAYIKTFHTIDEILAVYTEIGLTTSESQLRQKVINSFQSIVITEPTTLNWNSNEFKKMFELLLQKLKDESPYVQKASQQCLLTLSRMEEAQPFSKKLTPAFAGLYRIFCETQRQMGNLQGLQLLSSDKHSVSQKNINNTQFSDNHKSEKNLNAGSVHLEKITGISRQQSINKQALIERIEEIRRNSQTPKMPELTAKPEAQPIDLNRQRSDSLLDRLKNNSLLSQKSTDSKIEQLKKVKTILPLETARAKERELIAKQLMADPVRIHPIIMATKSEKIENIFGKKLLQDLKNDKDWKVRLEAIEQLQTKFQIYKEAFQFQGLVKNLVPPLLKLLSDQNFKIATITLKVLEDLFKIESIPLESIAPQVVEKLGDGKVSLRQGVARLIRSEYLREYNPIWLDSLLDLLKKTTNASLKQQILGIITRLYQDDNPKYPMQKLVESICPMMDDPKTKVKIRTLDLLVLIASSSQKIDAVKTVLISKLNQVYYEMFLQKVTKQMKQRATPRMVESEPPPKGQSRTISFPSLRKNNKSTSSDIQDSAKNTTSTSLQKYSKTIQAKPLQRGISYSSPKDMSLLSRSPITITIDEPFIQREQSSFTPTQTVRKKPIKSFQRKMQKTLESKLAITHTADSQNLRPFADPQREVKNLLNELKSQDWQNAYDALNKFRRLLKHHSQVLTASTVRPLALQVSHLVESLRSSLSKNAVMTLGECAKLYPKTIDPQLDSIFTKLMRKTLDTNSFISQQVKKTLVLIGSNCNQSRVVSCLMNYYTSRAIPIKINLLIILQAMITIPRVVEKQIQKIMIILVAFTNEGAHQIRDKTKVLILRLLDTDRTSKVMRALPAGVLDRLRKKQTYQLPLNDQSIATAKEAVVVSESKLKAAEEKTETVASKKKKKILVFPKQLDQLDQILNSAESSEWKIRQSTITKLAALIKKYPEEITQHKYSTRVIELFAKMANDPNSKVATSALSTFSQIVPTIPRLLQANLSVLANEVFNCFASQKTDVRQLSLNLFDEISDNIQHWMLVQHLCNGALYGPAKGKGNILVKLIKVLPQAFRERRSTVEKHLYGFVNKVSEQSKGDVTPIVKQLVKMTVSLGGEEASSSLRQAAKNLLNS